MANLVIDIGNSRTKIAIFNNRELVKLYTVASYSLAEIEDYLQANAVSKSIISSVSKETAGLEDLLSERTKFYKFSALIDTGVKLKYKSPQTLGLDRLAGVTGAQALFPNQNCLVIDAGTCITYDVITEGGNYSGGSISPGLNMRFNALHTFTGRLPLLNIDAAFDNWTGDDTQSSIRSGVQQGALSEVLGFINYYNNKYADMQVILCGGDSDFFGTRLKNSIFAGAVKTEPNLVLIGLNEVIQQHND